ncbi:hypothetical protein NLI96_g4900 [Meripilus lineatus]|uniref:Uncharacterized protein n=1 Tax=Meripilus lineatus TaxID=2056292 RepID=A0AAD5YHI2_9APHY|nr:hypothetical protein NLI96_g4900 [Physisporinus lineatus]
MATPTLLRRGVKLRKEAQLHSFHDFLFSNFHVPPRPFRYFRKLNLEFTDVGVVARNLDILTDIFRHASHLQDLSMGCFERLLENGPETFEAMATLPNLTSLTVDLIGRHGAKYLRGTTSPISNLIIGMIFRVKPIKLKHLGNIGATLTHLEIDCEGFKIAPSDLVFDHLRTLKIRASPTRYLASSWIFGPFPQLKHLILVKYNSETRSLAQVEEGHQRSLAELSRFNGPTPHLDVLVGDPLTFHRLSFFCPARALFLDRFCEERSLVLPRIIAKSQPYLLRIVLDAHDMPLNYFKPFCDDISGIASLKELWLRLNFEKGLDTKSKSLLVCVSHPSPNSTVSPPSLCVL